MSANSTVDVAFERELLDSLGRLLLSDQDVQHAREGILKVQGRVTEAAPVAFKHKVTTIVSANARSLMADDDPAVASAAARLAAQLADDEEAALAHRALLLEEVQRISGQLGDRAVVIKGFCNARFYPIRYTRWMRDIDLLCPSWADALDLLESLLIDGYEFDLDECSWVKADPAHGRDLYGQIFLIRPIGTDFSRVDIHFGTYSVGYAGYLDLGKDLFDQTSVGDSIINVLRAELCPLIAQAHALSDGYISAKDVNDFVALSTSREVDWKAIGALLRNHELHPQATRLANHILRLYDDQTVREAAQQLLQGLGTQSTRTMWQTHNRDWRLRARVNTSFAYRWRMRQGAHAAAGALDAMRCFLFYIRRLDLTVRDRSPRERLLRSLMATPDLQRWRLRPDACTLLIDAGVVRRLTNEQQAATSPLPVHVSSDFNVVEPGIAVGGTKGNEVVLLGSRAFIPTFDLIIPPEHAAMAPDQ